MLCDKYTVHRITEYYKSTCEIKNMCEDEQKRLNYIWTLRIVFRIARACLTNIDNFTILLYSMNSII